MSGTVTVRIARREKDLSRKAAKRVEKDLGKFTRKIARQQARTAQARRGSPWDDLLGSVSTDAPPVTNANIRGAMRSKRP
jgi:uncharacterized protein (DUF1778 family)